ncbi:HMG1/2-like protein [Lycium barbarum]|uniref:HMG1/2-like protein n=1 Tax=Lycium barbarum TaxID=112863 RepID=UPI00293F5236|nr:HMG1/2-like protein [Lycium barbarum]
MGKRGVVDTDYEEFRKTLILENQARLASHGIQKTITELRKIRSKPQSDKKKHNNFDAPLRRSNRGKSEDDKLSVKKSRTVETTKKAKGPKRPLSAFFVFMEEFRMEYKEKHPDNKSVGVVGKAGGEKWRSLSDEEKAPYQAKAEEMKAEYQKNKQDYNNKHQAGVVEEEESDKSSSEVNDNDEDED